MARSIPSSASISQQGHAIANFPAGHISHSCNDHKMDCEKIEQKVTCPLYAVRQHAESNDRIVKDSPDVDEYLQSLAPTSESDLDWKRSPSYPTPYIAELENVIIVPGSRVLYDISKGYALSDEIEMGFRCFGLRPKLPDVEVSYGPVLNFPLPPRSDEAIPSGIHLTGEHEASQ